MGASDSTVLFLCINHRSSTHILNAISPAFTASFAFADLIRNTRMVFYGPNSVLEVELILLAENPPFDSWGSLSFNLYLELFLPDVAMLQTSRSI